MTGKEVKEKTDEELLSMLHNLYEELFNLRIAKASANLTNPARFKQVRKDVARVKTVLNGRRRLAG
ncbi:50S ribosomal protein L29 [candidate division WOR-3 bacterium]|nr:50S ribosomal protein L29 [candidate division WOR-3 bacterium]